MKEQYITRVRARKRPSFLLSPLKQAFFVLAQAHIENEGALFPKWTVSNNTILCMLKQKKIPHP